MKNEMAQPTGLRGDGADEQTRLELAPSTSSGGGTVGTGFIPIRVKVCRFQAHSEVGPIFAQVEMCPPP